ncbi:rod shape-determining protein MreC [Thiohalocapsa marina]|uniref:Cell shape-determining protein MreC n=1 Tax=Thiohalocapsa marina TaxID=424902 RepID=A0A5M8FUG9_9GAMM|nr:rod shape-determining protein MreC [Thiohalocapsa marina]KAA6187389.1 rod shape-determining protein MreC [Thiohalocapsa marina]
MKPLFVTGPSHAARLALALLLSLTLMVIDSRWPALESLRAGLSVALYPVHYLAALPSRLVRAVDGRLATEAELRARNAQLEQENLALKGRLQTFDWLQSENRRLRDLLDSSRKLRQRVLVARLLEVDLDPYRQQVLVDKGSVAGVFVGQPVLDADAVMGQVIRTSPLTSTVLLITDAAHSLPVQIDRNGLRSIAEGSGLVDRLYLPHLPKNADVRSGDLLITSGLGGVFPPGYPVARITEVRHDPGNPFATVMAEPTARLDRSHEVLLVWSRAAAATGQATP